MLYKKPRRIILRICVFYLVIYRLSSFDGVYANFVHIYEKMDSRTFTTDILQREEDFSSYRCKRPRAEKWA